MRARRQARASRKHELHGVRERDTSEVQCCRAGVQQLDELEIASPGRVVHDLGDVKIIEDRRQGEDRLVLGAPLAVGEGPGADHRVVVEGDLAAVLEGERRDFSGSEDPRIAAIERDEDLTVLGCGKRNLEREGTLDHTAMPVEHGRLDAEGRDRQTATS